MRLPLGRTNDGGRDDDDGRQEERDEDGEEGHALILRFGETLAVSRGLSKTLIRLSKGLTGL
jgi:hypothetical protein